MMTSRWCTCEVCVTCARMHGMKFNLPHSYYFMNMNNLCPTGVGALREFLHRETTISDPTLTPPCALWLDRIFC